jgi:hypothetical protein
MKGFVIVLMVTGCQTFVAAQNKNYQPIDKLGWEMVNFSTPDKLTDSDSGSVKYLLTVNSKGKVTHIKLMNNTFPRGAEKLWRKMTKDLQFRRSEDLLQTKARYEGTLEISREPCYKERETLLNSL